MQPDPATEPAPSRRRVRSWLGGLRAYAIAPIVSRLDTLDARLDGLTRRMDDQARRMDGVEAFLQMVEARVATGSERLAMHAETDARLRRRLDSIASSLGGDAGAVLDPGEG